MLTGYTFCTHIKNKSAEEIVIAWRNHIAFPFGICRKLLTDNGTEFKNVLFSRFTKEICQLPDMDGFRRKGRLSFDSECVQDLG